MRGFITEKNWKEVDRTFPGAHRFYSHLTRKPHTFLELLDCFHSFDDIHLPQSFQDHRKKSAPARRKNP